MADDVPPKDNVLPFREDHGGTPLAEGFETKAEAEAYIRNLKSPYLRSLDGTPISEIQQLVDYVTAAETHNWNEQQVEIGSGRNALFNSVLTVRHWLQAQLTTEPPEASA
jgi:hypothetical protein